MAMVIFMSLPFQASGQSAVRRHNTHRNPAPVAVDDSIGTAARTAASMALPDSIPVDIPLRDGAAVAEDRIFFSGDSVDIVPVDTVGVLTAGEAYEADSIRHNADNLSLIHI